MLIAAALIELVLHDAGSLKDKRRVLRSLKDRVRVNFNVAIAEIDDQDDLHRICLGCVTVGSDPRYVREALEKVVRFVDGLALGELVSDDVVVARLDELDQDDDDEDDGHALPAEWEEE
jgi:hypothetical protein